MKKSILSLVLFFPVGVMFSNLPSNNNTPIEVEDFKVQTIKFPVNFSSKSTLIKGTWSNWSSWSQVKNIYFELTTITQGKIYNFRYFENGVMTKNYTITYNADATNKKKAENQNVNCYKINDSKDDWIYLYDTTMGSLMKTSTKWADSNNASISILDDEKTGYFVRIK